MTKEEIIKHCNELYGRLEELESLTEELLNEIKRTLRASEYLPSEISDFDAEEVAND